MMRTTSRLVSLAMAMRALVVVACCGGWSIAQAAPVYWIDVAGNYNGNFNDTAHWSATPAGPSGEPVPDASDVATFDNNQGTAYEVDLTSNATLGGFRVDTDNVTLDVMTNTISLGSGTSFQVGGAGEVGILTLGSSAGSGVGQISLTGNANMLLGSGASANGTLIIDNGAKLNNITAGATIAVGNGTGAQATLHVINGTAHLQGSSVGFASGGAASVDIEVSSAGSLYTHGFNNIATSGANDVDILLDGGTWTHAHTSRGVTIGASSGSQAANVDITVQNGGSANNVFFYQLAASTGKQVNYLVTGTGSSMRSRFNYIGGTSAGAAVAGSHTVTVEDNAILGGTELLRVYEASGSGTAATLTLDNGIVELDGNVSTPGVLDVRGVLLGNGTIRRRAGSGTALVNVDIAASGLMLPGDINGTPAIGAMTLENGTLDIAGTLRLDITDESQYDQVTVTGAGGEINLTGLLEVSFDDEFIPLGGETFNLLVAETIDFSGTYNVNLNPSFYTLSVLPNQIGSLDVLQLYIIPIPEPGTFGLLACAGLVLLRRRKK